MASTVRACMFGPLSDSESAMLMDRRYNGTSDLQLERMNVYFNEV